MYCVVSDPDCDPSLPEMRTRRERILYRLGLKLADRVTVQTERQRQMLSRGFGVDSVVIPMPCAGPEDAEFGPPRPPETAEAPVLWLGRVCEVKRPHLLLDAAQACPSMVFHLVGPEGDTAYVRQVLGRARQMANVVVHGCVSREEVFRILGSATVLLCTSRVEGFPNTFLEAWSHGLPIVSTFDPDGLIEAKGLGIVAKDSDGLAAGLRRLHGDTGLWRRCSANARRYYVENHRVEAVMSRFEQLFLALAR